LHGERLWREALTKAGIDGLSPIKPGSWYVPTRDLTDPRVLQKLLELHFAEYSEALDPSKFIDELPPLRAS
jgi:hypothetical protein